MTFKLGEFGLGFKRSSFDRDEVVTVNLLDSVLSINLLKQDININLLKKDLGVNLR